jgi:hypothetical protein
MDNAASFQFPLGKRWPVVCRDRVIRKAVLTGRDVFYNDVYLAAVQLTASGRRRTVSGWFAWDSEKGYFRFFATGANAALIPLTGHKPRLAKLARKLIAATSYSKRAEGLPSDHAAALAYMCQTEAAGLTEISGQESPGWLVRRILCRLWGEDVERLALFFDRLARFQSAAGE